MTFYDIKIVKQKDGSILAERYFKMFGKIFVTKISPPVMYLLDEREIIEYIKMNSLSI